jgi:hypothetical protein
MIDGSALDSSVRIVCALSDVLMTGIRFTPSHCTKLACSAFVLVSSHFPQQHRCHDGSRVGCVAPRRSVRRRHRPPAAPAKFDDDPFGLADVSCDRLQVAAVVAKTGSAAVDKCWKRRSATDCGCGYGITTALIRRILALRSTSTQPSS